MADVRPKFVLVESQGTTCSICSCLPLTQAAMNSLFLSSIYPLGQEIPLLAEENKRDKNGGEKKKSLFCVWMRNRMCWRDVRVFLMVSSEGLGLWSLPRAAACSWKLWGCCLEEMTFPRQQWVLQSLSKCVHISVGMPAAGQNFWFLSAFSRSPLYLTK